MTFAISALLPGEISVKSRTCFDADGPDVADVMRKEVGVHAVGYKLPFRRSFHDDIEYPVHGVPPITFLPHNSPIVYSPIQLLNSSPFSRLKVD